MQKDKIEENLKEIGLSPNEAKVYIAAIALGPSPVSALAKAADVKRTTVYPVIESLKQKGLMAVEVKGFKQLFRAESPEKLENVIELRKRQFEKNLPDLLSLYNQKETGGIIGYYEGREAIRNVYMDLLKDLRPHENYVVLSEGLAVFDALGKDWFFKFIQMRAKERPDVRVLYADNPWALEHKKLEQEHKIHIRMLPQGTKFFGNMTITSKRAFIHNFEDPIVGIVIENKVTIQVLRQMFDVMWDSVPDIKNN